VAVRVNNIWDPRLAPRAGEHTFSGGIYRDARLVVTAPLHVAWYGTFVTTPQVSKESGTVNVKTEVVNDSGAAKIRHGETRVVDAKGKTVAQMESTQTIAAGATNRVFDQTSAPMANPRLWSPEHPESLFGENHRAGRRQAGGRLQFAAGFPLVQVHRRTRGFSSTASTIISRAPMSHQDHAGWGDAVADSGFFRDVKLVKDAGFDFIRGSHYPHAPAFAAACDQTGDSVLVGKLFLGHHRFRKPLGRQRLSDQPGGRAGV
jgi:beta-galactosidase